MQLASRFAPRSPVLRSELPLSDDLSRAVAPSIFAEARDVGESEVFARAAPTLKYDDVDEVTSEHPPGLTHRADHKKSRPGLLFFVGAAVHLLTARPLPRGGLRRRSRFR
jgi:hypothetical protein